MRTYITRSDVAARAGTSTAVVSYVVNDGPRPVAPATRRRVEQAIRELGYVPDRGARALAGTREFTCGFLIPDITNPFFASLARALQDDASARGLTLLLGDSSGDREKERSLLDAFLGQRVDALILIGVDESSHLDAATRSGIPIVMLDRVDNGGRFSTVCIDNDAAAATATEMLLRSGRRRIGYVGGPAGLGVSELRLAGFRSALAAHGIAAAPEWEFSGPFSKHSGHEIGSAIAAAADRPDGLFVSSDQQAIGIIAAFAENSVGVPDEIALVSLDGTDDGRYTVPSLTSVQQPVDQIARCTLDLLENERGGAVEHVVVPHRLVAGGSGGEPRGTTTRLRYADVAMHPHTASEGAQDE